MLKYFDTSNILQPDSSGYRLTITSKSLRVNHNRGNHLGGYIESYVALDDIENNFRRNLEYIIAHQKEINSIAKYYTKTKIKIHCAYVTTEHLNELLEYITAVFNIFNHVNENHRENVINFEIKFWNSRHDYNTNGSHYIDCNFYPNYYDLLNRIIIILKAIFKNAVRHIDENIERQKGRVLCNFIDNRLRIMNGDIYVNRQQLIVNDNNIINCAISTPNHNGCLGMILNPLSFTYPTRTDELLPICPIEKIYSLIGIIRLSDHEGIEYVLFNTRYQYAFILPTNNLIYKRINKHMLNSTSSLTMYPNKKQIYELLDYYCYSYLPIELIYFILYYI